MDEFSRGMCMCMYFWKYTSAYSAFLKIIDTHINTRPAVSEAPIEHIHPRPCRYHIHESTLEMKREKKTNVFTYKVICISDCVLALFIVINGNQGLEEHANTHIYTHYANIPVFFLM